MDGITIGKEEFKALSSDTRIQIIKLLDERNYTLSELSSKLNMSSPTIKQHLETLVHSNLIEQQDEGRKWKYYSLTRKGKKLIEPESRNVMILLGATIIGCLFLVYLLFGTNLGGFAGTEINQPEKAIQDKAYSSLDAGDSAPLREKNETIQEILGKSKETTNMEFELIEQTNGKIKTEKYYLKDGKYRTEKEIENKEIIQIYDGHNLYAYRPNQEKTESGLSELAALPLTIKEDPAGIQETIKQALNDPELKETGKEIVNGLNTRIIEYSFNEQKVTAWVSEEYGIAVKKETHVKVEGGLMKKTTELINIKVGLVSNSLFEID